MSTHDFSELKDRRAVMEAEDIIANLQSERDELARELADLRTAATSAMEFLKPRSEMADLRQGTDAAAVYRELREAIAGLRAENACLVERLRQTPDMRSITADLRRIKMLLDAGTTASTETAAAQLNRLLRWLDESQ